MADNPYSPYVDRTGGAVAWGANPTNKRGPQSFPPLPAFKPYAAPSASPGNMANMAAAISRLRTTPAPAAAGAGAGSGSAGRGADASGMSVQGIEGIQGIPTTGALDTTLAVEPTVDPGTDAAIAPDSPDQPAPPTDTGATPPPAGGGGQGSVIARLRNNREDQRSTRTRGGFGPQY